MSLSAHFKNSASLDNTDLSWLSVTPAAAVREKEVKTERKSEPTEPKDSLPSKGAYLKNLRFNAYKSTRPALLTEITALITTGLQGFEREFGDSVPEHLILDLYSKGMERYIHESSLYQPFLRSAKDEYDKTVKQQMKKLASYVDFDRQLENKEKQHSNQLNETVNELQLQINELEDKLKASQESEKKLQKSAKDLSMENNRLQEADGLLRKELEATKATCNALSISLSRLVDDKNKSDMLESSMMVDLSHCKQVENSLNNEVDRLHLIIAQKDAIFDTLVAPERLASVQNDLEATQRENKRVSATHRQLLIRYAALKFMIDEAFRKLDDVKHNIGVPKVEGRRTQSAVQFILNEFNESKAQLKRKEALKLKTPTEKILELVEDSAYPKIVFECLLDQIEKLQAEKRKLLYGDAGDGLEGEEGVVINEDGEIAEVIPAGELIECLGLGEEVPCYLRMEGTVRNLHLDRRTTIEFVHEICAAKAAHEIQNAHIVHTAHISAPNVAPKEDGDSDSDSVESGRASPFTRALSVRPGSSMGSGSPPHSPLSQLRPQSRPWEVAGAGDLGTEQAVEEEYVPLLPTLPAAAGMAEFLECFLKDKVQNSVTATELAYNIVEALRLYADNSDCRLFSAMLAGDARVFLWVDQASTIEKLRSAVIRENAANTRSADGEWKLTQEKFMKVVRKMLSTRTEDEFNQLRDVMVELQNPDSRYVNATLLLYDGEEGERSPFLELIKLQHLEDCQSMERAVLAAVDQCVDPASPSPEVAISKLREALMLTDANKTRTEVTQLLARGAGCTVEAVLLREAKHVPLQLEEFKVNICTGLLKKSPVPAPKKTKK